MANDNAGGVEFELRRDLGLFDITMIGIGAMIGAGIFVLTGYAIEGAGPAAIIVFLLNGLVATMTALTYMELGSCFPQAGGSYLWVREGIPHPFGFLAGWIDWMAHIVACTLYALGFGSYLTWLFTEYNVYLFGISEIFAKIFAILVAIILLGINYIGTAATGKAENIVTVAKLGTLLIFIGFGLVPFIHNPSAISNFTENFLPEGFGGIAYAMGLTFIAFQGFEVIAQCGEEVKDPRKNIPKAILTSLVVVIGIYLAIAFIVIITVGTNMGDKPELVIVEAARSFMGPAGFIIMIVGGLVSTVSALNATVFSSSRVSFAMGRDGTLPKSLGKIHATRRTPSNAIILTGAIMIVIIVALPIEDVAASAGVMFLLLFSLANISLITLRRKMPYLQRGFVVPLVPILPLVATGLNLAVAIYLFFYSPLSWYIAIVWIELGLIGYYFTRGKEEIREMDKVEKLIGVTRRETGKHYHVLVPIANPENTKLIDFASSVAKHKDGDMILLNIAAIPDNLPIQNVDYEFVNRRVKTAEGLSDYSKSKHNIITRARVVVSHKILDTVREVVNKEKADITIIGWTGKPAVSRFKFGTNVDGIIQYAESDVAVLKGPIEGEIKKILLVPGFGIHAQRIAEIASFFARDNNSSIVVLGLMTPDKTETTVQSEISELISIIRSRGVPAEEQIIRTKRPISKITSIAKDYDFIMFGASEKWQFLRYAFGPIQDSVANKLEKPMLLLRAYEKKGMLSTSELGDEGDEVVKKTEHPKPVARPVPAQVPMEPGETDRDTMDTDEGHEPATEEQEIATDDEVPQDDYGSIKIHELSPDERSESVDQDDSEGKDLNTASLPESILKTDDFRSPHENTIGKDVNIKDDTVIKELDSNEGEIEPVNISTIDYEKQNDIPDELMDDDVDGKNINNDGTLLYSHVQEYTEDKRHDEIYGAVEQGSGPDEDLNGSDEFNEDIDVEYEYRINGEVTKTARGGKSDR